MTYSIELQDDFKELYELTVKLARRCAYDLRHVVEVSSPSFRKLYMPRLENYETIFEAATGAKNYRHRLHHKIFELECEIRRLREIMEKANVQIPEENPF